MSIELLSTEAKNQIIHDALYAYLLSGYSSWQPKIDFHYGLMKNAKLSLPAFLALNQKKEKLLLV